MESTERVNRLFASRSIETKRIALGLLAFAVLTVVGWRSMNRVSGDRPDIDSGMFASAALHLLEGKTLYRDVWDNKQPVVFFLNAAAMALGGRTVDSVRTLERVLTIAGCLLVFFIVRRIFANGWLAFATALAFPWILHLDPIFQGGNLTEEYGAIFVLGGILGAVLSRSAAGAWTLGACALSGFMFSLSVFTKEPFLFSAIPWFAYAVLGRDRSCRGALLRGGAFLAGAAPPALGTVGYVVARGAWTEWTDAMSYNLAYARHLTESVSFGPRMLRGLMAVSSKLVGQTWTGEVLLLLGVAGACARGFSRRFGHVPRVLVAAFACDLAGVLTSSVPDGHYLMQLVPSFTLLLAAGAALVGYVIGRLRHRRALAILALVALLAALDFRALGQYARDLARPSRRAPPTDVSLYVGDHSSEGDTVWAAPGSYSALYLESGRLSPSSYFFIFKHHFLDTWNSSGGEKLERLRTDLRRHPPKFILVSSLPFLEESGIMRWIRENYTPIPDEIGPANGNLWVARDPGI